MSENIRVLGRLMTEAEMYDLGVPEHYTNVFRDVNDNNILCLKPLSDFPSNYPPIDKVLCLCSRLDAELNSIDEERVASILERRLFVFRPMQSKIEYYAYEQRLLPKGCSPDVLDERYVAVPCFDLPKLGLSVEEFHSCLKNAKALLVEPCISDETDDRPECVIAKIMASDGDSYDLYLYFNIISMAIRDGASKLLIEQPEYHRIKLDIEDINNIIYDVDDNIIFIPAVLYDHYVERHRNDYIDAEEYLVSEPKDEQVVKQNIASEQEADKPSANLQQEAVAHKEEALVKEEGSILKKMKAAAKEMHLVYSDEDLINFYVSAHSSNLIVLAGMSGTGKSRLIKVYAKALGLDKYDGIKFISVSPAWTDDSDLLGYVDYKGNKYREAATELVTFLKRAAENRDKQYVICFDEMNLARVEHYFSSFLSILEDPETERQLVVYNRSLAGVLDNSNEFPATISLGDNVLFAGTVNIDESTFNFSDKVLDRANVIKLGMRPFTELKDVLEECCLSDRELQCLTDLHNMIRERNPKLGIGYRIIKQINSYINKIPEGVAFSRGNAFDRLIVQRIITKLRGSEEQLSMLIGKIDGNDKLVESDIMALLGKYKDVSEFTNVKLELKNKAKELMLYGYSV